jgi:hypothetical protein
MARCISARGTALLAMAFAVTTLSGQQRESEQEALLKKLATPGKEHQRLELLVGKWQLAVKWREKPDGKWTDSKGVVEYKSIFGSRFVVEEFKFDMGGKPMEWLGIYGYDNYLKKYTAVWVDNMGTNTEYADGKYDPAAKALSFLGEQDDPPSGGKKKFKWIITMDKDKLRFDSYDQDPPGKYFKNTEAAATRLRKDK